jgi:hypothetical protein
MAAECTGPKRDAALHNGLHPVRHHLIAEHVAFAVENTDLYPGQRVVEADKNGYITHGSVAPSW